MFFTVHKSPFIMLTMAITLLAGCDSAVSDEKSADLIRPAKIFTVADPSTQAIRNFPGEVEANADSKLAFRVSGQVIDFKVKPGTTVKKGDIIARLDPKDFELQIDDKQARYDLAKSKFDQAKLLLDRKLGSQAGYDEAKANLGVALSSLKVAKSDLEYTNLRAPFSGNISKVFIEKFDHIQAKQSIVHLQTRDLVDISIQIPENIFSRIDKDATHNPTVIFDSHPDEEFLATIKEFDTQADPSTLTYKVVFSLPTPESFNVLPGMSANIRIDLSQIIKYNVKQFIVPVSSVFSPEDKTLESHKKFVWKLDPNSNKVTRVEVEVGELKSNGIQVLSGITSGDKIVSAGSHFLTEGMEVRPWNREKGL